MSIFNPIKYKIWNYTQLEAYMRQRIAIEDDDEKLFEGFDYYFVKSLIHTIKGHFSKETYEIQNLTSMEIQKKYTSTNPLDYHRFVVALDKDKIIGIIVCYWIKMEKYFWSYYISFVEVQVSCINLIFNH